GGELEVIRARRPAEGGHLSREVDVHVEGGCIRGNIDEAEPGSASRGRQVVIREYESLQSSRIPAQGDRRIPRRLEGDTGGQERSAGRCRGLERDRVEACRDPVVIGNAGGRHVGQQQLTVEENIQG